MITSPDGNTVYATVSKGQNGQAINNTDDISLQIISALQDGQPVNLALNTTSPPRKATRFKRFPTSIGLKRTSQLGQSPRITARLRSPNSTISQKAPRKSTQSAQLSPDYLRFSERWAGTIHLAQPGQTQATRSEPRRGNVARPLKRSEFKPLWRRLHAKPGGTQASLCSIHYVTYWGPGGYAFHEAWWLTPDQLRTRFLTAASTCGKATRNLFTISRKSARLFGSITKTIRELFFINSRIISGDFTLLSWSRKTISLALSAISSR